MFEKPSYEDLEKRLKDLEQEHRLAIEAARESEERYKALFERSFDVVYILDFEGRFLDASNAGFNLLGYSRKELENITLTTLLTDEQIPKVLRTIQELKETGTQRESEEYMVKHKDGGFVWLESRASVIYRSTEPYAIQGIARDVTAVRKAQEQLRKSSERYRTIFENTGNASICIGEDTTILLANSNFERLSGYSKEELEGKMSWTVFIADEDIEKMKRYHAQRRENPESAPGSYDFRFKNRYGEKRYIFLTIAMIPGTHESVASCMDITDRKRAEEALSQSEERYRGILENIEEGYFELDLKGNFTFNNEASCRGLGYSQDEIHGMNYRKYMTPETAKQMLEVYSRIYKTRNPEYLVDYEVFQKDGSVRVHEMTAALLLDPSGQPKGFRGLVRDVTERKKVEDALKTSEGRYRAIFENTGNATILIGDDKTILLANSNFEGLSGYSRHEIEGKMTWESFISEDDLERLKNYHRMRREKPGSAPESYEFRFITRSGEVRDILALVTLIPGTNESISNHIDITERKQAEEALRISEDKYRRILESMEESYFEVDFAGNFTFFNNAAVRMSGYSPEELLGMNYRTYSPPETAKLMFESFNRVFKTGKPELLVDYQVNHKDGSLHDNELSVWLMRDASGQPTGFNTLVRDVTVRKRSEKALRESEERYRSILDNMEEAYYEVDLKGNFTFFNPRPAQRLGYAHDELMGVNYRQYIDDKNTKKVFNAFHKVFLDGEPISSVEWELNEKNGHKIYVDASVSLRRDANGAPIGFSGVVRDITSRKQAEDALRVSEEKYRSILESMEEAYLESDLSGNFTFFNDSLSKVLGYTREELCGMNYRSISTSETSTKLFQVFNDVYSTGKPKTLVDHELIRKDGSKRVIEMSVSLIRDTSGEPAGFRGVGRDITERIQAEQALKESESRYRLLAENLRDVIWVLDTDLHYVYVSPSVMELRGYTPEEVMEHSIDQALTPESYQRIADLFAQERLLELGGQIHGKAWTKNIELEMIRKDGSTVWTEVKINILYDEAGNPTGILGITRDITERRLADEVIRKSEELYRTTFESTATANIIIAEDTTILLANSNFEKMSGYSGEELEGKMSWTGFVVAEDLERMKRYHLMRRNDSGSALNSYEFRFKDRKGEIRDLFMSVALIPGTKESVSSMIDITERNRSEKALRESEARWQFALEGAGDGVWDYDLINKKVYRSRRWKEMLGYTDNEIDDSPKAWSRLIHPEDRQQSDNILERHLAGELPVYTSEHRVKCKDGSYKWVLDRGKVFQWSEDGNPARIIGTQTDITERKQIEEAIRESEEQYRTIFENTGNASMLLGEDRTVLLVNSNFEKLSGYLRQEVEGKMSWTTFVSPEDLERMKRYHEERREGIESVPRSYEFRFLNRSGESRDIFLSIALIPGSKVSVASLMDITDRKNAEKALRESEERFRDLASLMPETVFETNEKGFFTFVNQSSFERFGVSTEEMNQGISVLDVIAPEDHERMMENYKRVMRGEKIGLNEYVARKKDGTTFPALVHTTCVYHDDKPAGLRGFLIDMTEKKNLEQQLTRAQKMEAVGTLAGGIAHDFNNLLMGILGNVSLILMHFDESHPFFDRLKSVEEYVQRGSDLTKQLLGFARGGKYEVKPTHLGEFIQKSSDMFGRTKKEIRIHHKIAQGLWAVDVDRGQMEQVMLNLFVNAWQAMPGGGDLFISVENINLDEVEVSPYDIIPGRFVKVTVTDTGIGMDESVKMRIFEPFFTTKERGRGTGLGLASVYGIIKNHGGFINVESEKDLGTSFMIFLPASDKDVPGEQKTNGEILRGHETILLIDDEEMILDIGSKMLEGLGYKVLTAPGGRQGLRIYEQARDTIDLVILDIIMPDFGGKETFDTLRRVNPEVKVMLSSGYSLDGQAKEIMKNGCKGFIQKPFSMAEFSKKIRDILDQQ